MLHSQLRLRPTPVAMIAITWMMGAYWTCQAGSLAWQTRCERIDSMNIETLNAKLRVYREHCDRLPDLNLIELYRYGLTQSRLQKTPFGGFYQLDPSSQRIINPARSCP